MQYRAELKEVSRRLRKARLDLNLSVDDVAREAGVHPNTISRIESGNRDVYLTTIIHLLRVYELPFSYLDPDQVQNGYE